LFIIAHNSVHYAVQLLCCNSLILQPLFTQFYISLKSLIVNFFTYNTDSMKSMKDQPINSKYQLSVHESFSAVL